MQHQTIIPPRIKICGMRDIASVDAAVRYGAHAVGFITEVPVDTHRRIDRDTARTLVAATPPFVTTVMVFMPDNLMNALDLIEFVRPDAVQVHTPMSLADLRSLKERTSVKLIKTVNVGEDTSAEVILDYISELEHIADAVLLDTQVGTRTGGTGTVHDWTISTDVVAGSSLPVILAGGLNPGNVTEAVRTVKPYAVDTVSGVETRRIMDEDKLRLFVENVRRA